MTSYPARPPKIPPQHPGVVLADLLDEQRISLRKAAEAIGMSHSGLDKVLKGTSPVTPETALRLGTWLGNGPELWLNLQQAYDLWRAREQLGDALGKIKPVKDAA
jgi:addiction module HigA family antidote